MLAILCPASNPKLKQALSTPDTIATNIPSANLYSEFESLATSFVNSFSFITPAFPLIMIPTIHISNPAITVNPQLFESIPEKVSFPITGLKS